MGEKVGIGKIIQKAAFPLAIGAFGLLVILERRRPLRKEVESKALRSGRNMAIAGLAAAAIFVIERPVSERAAFLVEQKNLGLLKRLGLPKWLERAAAVVFLDYTLYLWHRLTHRVPFLWRFHIVHHADLDLDASTACRFHFGEIAISVAWRALQIVVIGVTPDSLRIWQSILLPSILFHHSNVEMPYELEKYISKFVITPRMHGIHHSVVKSETDSNWSSGLSIWDRLHGTFRDISQHGDVIIGVPAYRSSNDVSVKNLLTLPFDRQTPVWNLADKHDRNE